MCIFAFIISIILVGIAGYCEAIMDKLLFHYNNSSFKFKPNQHFWNPAISWVNKYKQDLKTPRFFGSTTLFVFMTDAWHFFKFLRTTFLFIGLGMLAFHPTNILFVVFSVSICRIVYGLSFTYFFSKFNLI